MGWWVYSVRDEWLSQQGGPTHLRCTGQSLVCWDRTALTGGGSVGRSTSGRWPGSAASVAEARHHLGSAFWEDELLAQLHVGPALSYKNTHQMSRTAWIQPGFIFISILVLMMMWVNTLFSTLSPWQFPNISWEVSWKLLQYLIRSWFMGNFHETKCLLIIHWLIETSHFINLIVCLALEKFPTLARPVFSL